MKKGKYRIALILAAVLTLIGVFGVTAFGADAYSAHFGSGSSKIVNNTSDAITVTITEKDGKISDWTINSGSNEPGFELTDKIYSIQAEYPITLSEVDADSFKCEKSGDYYILTFTKNVVISGTSLNVEADYYTISYYNDANNIKNQIGTRDYKIQLLSAKDLSLSKKGYEFQGWSKSSTGTTVDFEDGDTITLTGNTNLYAVWGPYSLASSVSMADYYAGQNASKPDVEVKYKDNVLSEGTDYSVTYYQYKKISEADSTFTNDVPNQAGDYQVRARIKISSTKYDLNTEVWPRCNFHVKEHIHTWEFVTSEESPDTVTVRCSDEKCEYFEGKTFTLTAESRRYNGNAFTWGNKDISLKIEGNAPDATCKNKVTSYYKYEDDGKEPSKLSGAPKNAGKYKVSVTADFYIENAKIGSATLSRDVEIIAIEYQPTVSIDKTNWTYLTENTIPQITYPEGMSSLANIVEVKHSYSKGSDSVEYTENSPLDAGTYTILTTITDPDGNYVVEDPDLLKSEIRIDPFKVKIIVDDKAKYVGKKDPEFTYQVKALEGDSDVKDADITGKLVRDKGENPGTYAIDDYSGLTSTSGNYAIGAFEYGLFTIKATGADPQGRTVVYNGEEQELVEAVTETDGTSYAYALKEGDTEPEDSVYSSDIPTKKDAGEYTYYYKIADADGNPIGTEAKTLKAEIKAAPLTVIPDEGQYKTYGDNDPDEFTYTLSGLQGNDKKDDAIVEGGKLGREGKLIDGKKYGRYAGIYAYTLGSLKSNDNYTLSLQEGRFFEVKPKTLQVSAGNKTKVYGEVDPPFTYTVDGVITKYDKEEEVLTGELSRRTSSTASQYVGNHTIRQGSLAVKPITVGDEEIYNYTIEFTKGTLTITPAELTITPDSGQKKTYGDAEPVITYKAEVFKYDDSASSELTGSLSREEGADAGTYKIKQGTLAVVGHWDSKHKNIVKNYTINFTKNVDFTIERADINPTVTIEDWTEGQTAKTPVITGNSGDGSVTYTYYTDAALTTKTGTVDGATAEGGVPSKANTYYLVASIETTKNYNSGTASTSFKINSAPSPTPAPSPSVDDPVQKVVDMLKALDPNASDYAAKAQEAIDAYNKLTDDQKADKRFEEQTVATKLAGAQEAVATAADKKAADEASALINKLPVDPATAKEADAQAAYAAYMALTDTQKALLDDSAKKKVAVYGHYYETQYAKAQTVKLKSVKAKKGRKAVAKWSKNADVSGYQLYYKAKGTKAKKVTISKASTVKKTVKKLKAGKKYSFKVRTYTKVYNPSEGVYERVYGQWSNVKKAKAKK